MTKLDYPGWPGAYVDPLALVDAWGEPQYLIVPPQRVMGGWLMGGRVLNPEWAGNCVLSEN